MPDPAAPAPPPCDVDEECAARLDAGLDQRVRRAGGDKARGRSARAGRRRAADRRAGATPEAPSPSTSGSRRRGDPSGRLRRVRDAVRPCSIAGPAGAFNSPGSAPASGSEQRPASRKPLKYQEMPWSPGNGSPGDQRLPKDFQELQRTSKGLPKTSKDFQKFPKISKNFRRPPGPGDAEGWRTAARGAARGLPLACNPLICRDRTSNEPPNLSTTKGFVGRSGRRRFRPGSPVPARH